MASSVPAAVLASRSKREKGCSKERGKGGGVGGKTVFIQI